MSDEILSAEQAAEFLGITPNRVRQLCRSGRLGKKLGVQWLIPRAELEAFAKIPRKVGRPAASTEGEVNDETH